MADTDHNIAVTMQSGNRVEAWSHGFRIETDLLDLKIDEAWSVAIPLVQTVVIALQSLPARKPIYDLRRKDIEIRALGKICELANEKKKCGIRDWMNDIEWTWMNDIERLNESQCDYINPEILGLVQSQRKTRSSTGPEHQQDIMWSLAELGGPVSTWLQKIATKNNNTLLPITILIISNHQ